MHEQGRAHNPQPASMQCTLACTCAVQLMPLSDLASAEPVDTQPLPIRQQHLLTVGLVGTSSSGSLVGAVGQSWQVGQGICSLVVCDAAAHTSVHNWLVRDICGTSVQRNACVHFVTDSVQMIAFKFMRATGHRQFLCISVRVVIIKALFVIPGICAMVRRPV